MAFNHRALALLGLLDLDTAEQEQPSSDPLETEQHGHWRVEHHLDVSVWRCLCGRSEPLLVPAQYRKRVRLPNDLVKACEVCRHELATADSKTSLLLAFLERHRPLLNEHDHLEYREDRGYLFSFKDGQSARTKRVVFEAFYKKTLGAKDHVSSMCRNPLCINPYHLCVKSAPNLQVTPQMKALVGKLFELGLSAETTRSVLNEKFETQLCLSTIQKIRAGLKQSAPILN